MAGSHKETIEQLIAAINARHVNHLDKSLEDNVVKIINSYVGVKLMNINKK